MTSIRITDFASCQNSLEVASTLGLIQPVQDEDSSFVLCTYRGTGFPVSAKWNVKVYRNRKGRVTAVTTDTHVFVELLASNWSALQPSNKSVLQIDDAGIGFPLGGVMIGVTDGTRVETAVVPPTFFQSTSPKDQQYLEEYARMGTDLLARFDADPGVHRIEICNGFINSRLTTVLRTCGFEVHKVEIKGILQDTLENRFRDYIRELVGFDLYYDPKEVDKGAVAPLFDRALSHGLDHRHLAKTSWKCF